MIIAIGEDGVIEIFEDIAAVRMKCEGLDVESHVWDFFDASGLPLEPVFVEPNQRTKIFGKVALVKSGRFDLVPARDPSPTLLQSLTDGLLLDPNPHLASLAELRTSVERAATSDSGDSRES